MRIPTGVSLHWPAAILVLMLVATPFTSAMARSFYNERLKVTGSWDGSTIVATRIQDRDSFKDPRRGRIEGSLSSLEKDEHILRIGPIDLLWTEQTRFEGTMPDILKPGDPVEASVELLDSQTLWLRSLTLNTEEMPSDSIQIIGAVSKEEHVGAGTIELTILGTQFQLKPRFFSAVMLTSRPDDRRPDEQLTLELAGRPLTIGGEFEIQTRRRDDFALEEEDSETRLDLQTQLEIFYPVSERIAAFFEVKAERESEVFTGEASRETTSAVERGEMWLYMNRFLHPDLALQIGRQNFVDEREWWWDEDLDALRLHYDRRHLKTELAVAQEVGRVSTREGIDPEDEDILRLLGRASWLWRSEQRLDFFGLLHRDRSERSKLDSVLAESGEDESDADLTWLGLRASGQVRSDSLGRLYYWFDTAQVNGNEERVDFAAIGDGLSLVEDIDSMSVRGWAYDVGVTWRTPTRQQLSFTVGFAQGSGDTDLQNGTDMSFRQTGLQDNNSKFRGIDRFRYYGEALRPELSNLSILTVSLGRRFLRNSSVEFLYHQYTQVDSAPFLRRTSIDADPNGLSNDIGQEIDIVIGIEEWEHLELELVGGLFRPGEAFGELARDAVIFDFKVNYNF